MAMDRPTTKNKAFQSAWEKGRKAGLAGEPSSSNPYWDHRTLRGGVTFSRAFQRYWNEGWKAGKEERTLFSV